MGTRDLHGSHSHRGHTFEVEIAIVDVRRSLSIDLARLYSPARTTDWLVRSYSSVGVMPPVHWTGLTARYRGYGELAFRCEHLPVEAWNNGYRWSGLCSWIQMNAWGAGVSDMN